MKEKIENISDIKVRNIWCIHLMQHVYIMELHVPERWSCEDSSCNFCFWHRYKHVARSCSCEDQAVTHRQAHMHTRRLLQPSAYMLGLISQERACTVHVHVILYRQLCTKTKQKPDTTCIQV